MKAPGWILTILSFPELSLVLVNVRPVLWDKRSCFKRDVNGAMSLLVHVPPQSEEAGSEISSWNKLGRE